MTLNIGRFIIALTLLIATTKAAAVAKQLPHEKSQNRAELSSESVPLTDSYCSQLKEFQSKAKWSWGSQGPVEPDQIVVDKSRRTLHLLFEGKVVRSYKVALGRGGPVGPKRQSGDNKTPEGKYIIEYKNSASDYHLALKISYPNQDDIDWARKNGVNPGGDIMIHGLPNSAIKRAFINHPNDWTKGCVAVNDSQIEEIFDVVSAGTPIELCR